MDDSSDPEDVGAVPNELTWLADCLIFWVS